MSREQKQVGFRVAIFIVALVTMILLAGFGFPTEKDAQSVGDKIDISISKND